MDEKTVGGLVMGGLVAGAIAFLFKLLGKRHDKVDKIEDRVVVLERAQVEVAFLKIQVEEVRQDLKKALDILTDLRIQLNTVPKRRNTKLLSED